jgi:hypothetical protein
VVTPKESADLWHRRAVAARLLLGGSEGAQRHARDRGRDTQRAGPRRRPQEVRGALLIQPVCREQWGRERGHDGDEERRRGRGSVSTAVEGGQG